MGKNSIHLFFPTILWLTAHIYSIKQTMVVQSSPSSLFSFLDVGASVPPLLLAALISAHQDLGERERDQFSTANHRLPTSYINLYWKTHTHKHPKNKKFPSPSNSLPCSVKLPGTLRFLRTSNRCLTCRP